MSTALLTISMMRDLGRRLIIFEYRRHAKLQWRPSSQLISSLLKHNPGIRPCFLSQKIAQKAPEKKMPSTAANGTMRSAKLAMAGLHHLRAHCALCWTQDGSKIANQSDATTSTWMASQDKNKFSCWANLHWLSEQAIFWGRSTKLWLQAQSEVPFHMWYKPSGRRADQIPLKMQTVNLVSFYQDSSAPTEMMTPSKPNKRPFPFLSLTN